MYFLYISHVPTNREADIYVWELHITVCDKIIQKQHYVMKFVQPLHSIIL